MESKINPMREIRVASVVLNMSVGSSESKLEGALKVLEKLSGQTPSLRRAKKSIKEFKIRKGEPIACMVTLRGKKAVELLDRLLESVNRKIKASSFTDMGNFSFGIKEYIDIPGMSYDPSIGILGMDVCVNLARPGMRVQHRRVKASSVGKDQRVTKQEAIEFMKEKFKVEII
ncbi:MAG TPA: 50S ribosomal protein L5 [Geobacterales bacterium]|nr:50S ribosomal protein L5 [Geobacterales bacterium]